MKSKKKTFNAILEKIKLDISKNIYGDTLPSERKLAEIYFISRSLLREILHQLTIEKLLLPAGNKTVRKIKSPESSSSKSTQNIKVYEQKNIIFLSQTQFQHIPPRIIEALYQIEHTTLFAEYKIHIHFVPPSKELEIKKQIENIITNQKPVAWILYRCDKTIQQIIKKQNIASLIIGSAATDIKIPCLDRDWVATTRHAEQMLWQRGSRNIVLVLSNYFGDDNVYTVEKAFFNQKLKDTLNNSIIAQFSSDDFIQKWNNLYKKIQPTGIIVGTPQFVIPILNWTYKNNISIPKDINIVSLTHEVFMDFLSPPVAYYKYDPAIFTKKLTAMLYGLLNGNKVSSRLICPDFFANESLA